MFKFELRQKVSIAISGEEGIIKGRADYANAEDGYFVHYRSADGCASDKWFTADELEAIPESMETL